MFQVRRTLACGAMAAAGLAMAAAPAFALNHWATQSNPLIVKEDGVAQGKAFGYHEIDLTSNGTRSHGELRLLDPRPGGSGVYGEMWTQTPAGYCFTGGAVNCTAQWYDWAKDESDRWLHDYWSPYHWTVMTTSVNPNADKARGRVRVGEDQNNSPDPHSGWAYSAGSRYTP